MTTGYVTIKKAMECQAERDKWRKRAQAAELERDELARELEAERYQRRAVQESEQALAAHAERLSELSERVYSACDEDDAEESMAMLRECMDNYPAASLAAHDAALLRRAAREIGPDCDRKTDANILLDNMADAIERGES